MVAYSFQRQFVPHICAGLMVPIPEGFHVDLPLRSKRQTIRALGKRRHARPGETLQLYRGLRTQQCFKIADAKCVTCEQIRLEFGPRPRVIVGTGDLTGNRIESAVMLDGFAESDGFEDWAALVAFWQKQHGPLRKFTGVIVYWEPLS